MKKIFYLLLLFAFIPNFASASTVNQRLYDEKQAREAAVQEGLVKQEKYREESTARDVQLSEDLQKAYEQQQITNVLIRDLMRKVLELETKIEGLQLQLDQIERDNARRDLQYIDE